MKGTPNQTTKYKGACFRKQELRLKKQQCSQPNFSIASVAGPKTEFEFGQEDEFAKLLEHHEPKKIIANR